MIYFVGTGWAVGFFLIMLVALGLGIGIFAYRKYNDEKKPFSWKVILCAILTVVFAWFWLFAATHFRVGINERALLINTIDQTIIGVEDSGVQRKPLLGVSIKYWPANTQYQIPVTMKGGIQSATTKNGTVVYDDVTIYVDLSKMDIAAAYKAVNGNWEVFLEKNLLPGLLSVSRSVSGDFSTNDHTFLRDQWEKQFETETTIYLSDSTKGFNISIINGRTVLSWDFVNPADATAYDDANRAAYEITKKENELAALKIEAQKVATQNQIKAETADGTVINLDKMSDYLLSQPEEVREYLMEYLKNIENMEYLRIVGGGDYSGTVLPPNSNSSAMVSADSSSNKTAEPATTSSPQG